MVTAVYSSSIRRFPPATTVKVAVAVSVLPPLVKRGDGHCALTHCGGKSGGGADGGNLHGCLNSR